MNPVPVSKPKTTHWLRDGLFALGAIGIVAALMAYGSAKAPSATPTLTITPKVLQPLTAQSTVNDVATRMLHSSANWHSLSLTALQTLSVDDTPETWSATLIIQQPNKFRALWGPQYQPPTFTAVSDGTSLSTFDALTSTVTTGPLPDFAKGIQTPTPAPPFYEPQAIMLHPLGMLTQSPLSDFVFPFNIWRSFQQSPPTIVGFELVAGRDAVVLLQTYTDDSGALVKKKQYWVDALTGIVLKSESYGNGGDWNAISQQTVVTEFSLNPAISYDVFLLGRPSPTNTSLARTATAAAAQSPEEFLEKVKAKGELMARILLNKPGWVRTVQTTTNPPNRPGSTLANGAVIPPTFILETWANIDAEGIILESVTYMHDPDGNIIQASVSHGGTGTNITLDTVHDIDNYRVYADDPFYRSLQSAKDYGFELTLTLHTEDSETGEMLTVITASDTAESPGTLDNGDLLVISGSRAYYTQDATLIKIVGFYVTDKGDEVTTSTETYRLIERIDAPPDEVLELLKQY